MVNPSADLEKFWNGISALEKQTQVSSLVEGINNSISNSQVVQKSAAYFLNPDVQRDSKKWINTINSYNDGVLTFISPLSKADEIVLPFGIAKYSTKEREDRLQQIASLKINGQKKSIRVVHLF
ncbi:MAG: hypothetical protein H0T62_03165 [Parachlamydiaceae bacterium]|nr:hypothetical protein [Parachlamydiaceae bacterium]